MRKAIAYVLGAAVCAAGSWLLLREPTPPVVTAPVASPELPRFAPPTAQPSPVDKPAPVHFDPSSDPRIATLRTEADFTHYLEVLEGDVNSRGSTGDALARASAAGEHVREKVGAQAVALRLGDFGERIHRMERARDLKSSTDELEALAPRIAKERDPKARALLVARYDRAARMLPEPGRIAANEKLRTLQNQ